MTTRSGRNAVKFDAKEITIERATNGWIITPKYDGIYSDVPSEIATTQAQALEAAKGFMSKPFVREEDY